MKTGTPNTFIGRISESERIHHVINEWIAAPPKPGKLSILGISGYGGVGKSFLLNSVLAEPIEDCLARDAHGDPCLEARSPVDLEDDLGLHGGHIFHRDLSWPWGEPDDGSAASRWGVATGLDRVLLCGAGARRGGGVSAIPGRSAAMALLGG